jgi:Spy/CpxP family protein refolding chaperone
MGWLGAKAQQTTTPATDKNADYVAVVTKRADKIVKDLGITDSVKYKKVLNAVFNQYAIISAIYDNRDAQVATIKQAAGDNKAAATEQIKTLDEQTTQKVKSQHQAYIAQLNNLLTTEQIEKVKDGMTFGVLPLTYNAYLDEVQTLTDAQKQQIKIWLTEARELALDAPSAKKKHEVFGKYKGRINNYLSAQGYDMKKEGEEWQKRIKASQEQSNK